MPPPRLDLTAVGPLVRAALREDLGRAGDVTSRALIPAAARARATLMAKQPGVVAGLPAAALVFRTVDRRIRFHALVRDGARVRPGAVLARLTGPTRGLLAGERVALNVLQRLSGIATLTRRFADLGRPWGVAILDTRKTTPTLRALEKYAVRCGGGRNHRMGLYDAILIKDNHVAAVGSVGAAVARARRASRLPVEVECQSLAQIREAVAARPAVILLDNLGNAALRRAIRLIRSRRGGPRIELSGGMTLARVARLVRLRPDFISIGALTHSAPALDISLDLELA